MGRVWMPSVVMTPGAPSGPSLYPTFQTHFRFHCQSEVSRLFSTWPEPLQLHYSQREWLQVFSWSLTLSDHEHISKYFQSPSSDLFHFKNRCQESKGLRPQVKIKTHSQAQPFSLLFPPPWIECAHTGAVHMKSNLYKDECRRSVQFHASPRAGEGVRLEGEGPAGLILQDSTVKCCA